MLSCLIKVALVEIQHEPPLCRGMNSQEGSSPSRPPIGPNFPAKITSLAVSRHICSSRTCTQEEVRTDRVTELISEQTVDFRGWTSSWVPEHVRSILRWLYYSLCSVSSVKLVRRTSGVLFPSAATCQNGRKVIVHRNKVFNHGDRHNVTDFKINLRT